LSRTGTYKDSKAKRLREPLRRHFFKGEPDDISTKEKQVLMVEEMLLDTTLAMATGSLGGWYNLVDSYDSDKDLLEQDATFQYNASVLVASNIGLGLTLHAVGMTQLEFTVGRSIALRPITSFVFSPIIAAPVAMAYMTATQPAIAGPQYQSAMTGQPGIGSGGHDLIFGNKKWSDYWDAIWS